MGTYCEISREEYMKQEKEQYVSSDEESSSPQWRIAHPATPGSSYNDNNMDFESSMEEELGHKISKYPQELYKETTIPISTTPKTTSTTTTPSTTKTTTTTTTTTREPTTSTTTRRKVMTTTMDDDDDTGSNEKFGTTSDKFYQEPLCKKNK